MAVEQKVLNYLFFGLAKNAFVEKLKIWVRLKYGVAFSVNKHILNHSIEPWSVLG